MKVIPVIDIRGGVVVHAMGGERARYRPIATPLAPGSACPLGVVRGLLAVYPFSALYVADLDGIGGGAADLATVRLLARNFPHLELWVDNGAARMEAVRALVDVAQVVGVIGSETLTDGEGLGVLVAEARGRSALSLDFRGDAFLGPAAVVDDSAAWPGRVIVMSLQHVGADAGPDLARVGDIARRASSRLVVAAGGVRGVADLKALAARGAGAALVASALHSGKLKAGDLDEVAGL